VNSVILSQCVNRCSNRTLAVKVCWFVLRPSGIIAFVSVRLS